MIKLGDKVKDKITGYTGIVIGISKFLQGCRRIGVQAQKLHEGTPISAVWFDEPQLEVVKTKKKVIERTPGNNGGPISSIPTRVKDAVK